MIRTERDLYSPKTHQKRCVSGSCSGGSQDLDQEALVQEIVSCSRCSGAAGVGTRYFKTFIFPEQSDENMIECLLPINKALVFPSLEHFRTLLASASEKEHGGGRYR